MTRIAVLALATLLSVTTAAVAEDLAEGEEGYMDYTITSARIGQNLITFKCAIQNISVRVTTSDTLTH